MEWGLILEIVVVVRGFVFGFSFSSTPRRNLDNLIIHVPVLFNLSRKIPVNSVVLTPDTCRLV
jgi:hypothetical protein